MSTSPSDASPNLVPTSLSTSQAAVLPQAEPFTPPVQTVKDFKDYDFYGRFSTLLTRLPEAAEFVASNTDDINDTDLSGKSRIQALALAAITSFLNTSHQVCQTPKSCCWFTIRMTKPFDEFTVPRWHSDGNYYGTDFSKYEPEMVTNGDLEMQLEAVNGTNNHHNVNATDPSNSETYILTNTSQPPSKFATTFLGPPTLLLNIPHTAHLLNYLNNRDLDFSQSWRDDSVIERRERIDKYLVPSRTSKQQNQDQNSNDDSAPDLNITVDSNTNADPEFSITPQSETPPPTRESKVTSLPEVKPTNYDDFPPSGAEMIPAPELGQIVRFAWGSKYAIVHSEPDMSGCDRVFVSVLFGSEREMRHMCGYREVEFVE